MRATQKRQVLDCIESLRQAHEEIEEALRKNKYVLVQNMLSECQSFAVSLGENIEVLEGKGHITIAIMEKYCEILYHIYREIDSGRNNNDKICKMLKKQLLKLENSVKNDICVRKEVVFLPYKASMWDSFESIWMAADEDPDCDVYVIPIPYYDKKTDGSLGVMHYEANQYPRKVPVVSYMDYDIEKHRPDMIFIHNPYDECNYVTSVEPFYYSSNLKKFTEKLIYIPYFILREINITEKQAIEEMKHFCHVPGVLNADRVIVQSENMRQVYINILTETYGERSKNIWEKKIWGLGSPKVDKVLDTSKEDLQIPEKWKKIIERSDGSWKKIIFYNTTVAALLSNNEKMLEKIQDVFRVFQKNKDDVVLLWRPHPLMEATLKSMRPQIWEEYQCIRNKYKKDAWGIYDDSADLERAIILSDAYYGDGSSVVHLYRMTGKPVLLQNMNALPDNNYSLAMDNIIENQGKWWFLALKDNGIYQMDMDAKKAYLVVRIPWKGKWECPQYGKIYSYKNKIFIIPRVPIDIAVFNTEKQELYYIDYEKEKTDRGLLFCEGIINENKLYLIPCAYENILCLDMDTEAINYIRLDIALREKGKKHRYAWGKVFYNGEKIFMTMLERNLILSFELQTGKIERYHSELLDGGGAGICGDENNVWIVPRVADRIIHWDREKRTVNIMKNFPEDYQSGDFSIYKIVACGKYLYLLPRKANMCILIDKITNDISSLEMEEKPFNSQNYYDQYCRYINVWKNDGCTYIIHTRTGDIYSIDESSRKITGKIKHDKIYQKDNKTCRIYGETEYENRFENIENYIGNLSKIECNIQNSHREKVGKKIWECIKREI